MDLIIFHSYIEFSYLKLDYSRCRLVRKDTKYKTIHSICSYNEILLAATYITAFIHIEICNGYK